MQFLKNQRSDITLAYFRKWQVDAPRGLNYEGKAARRNSTLRAEFPQYGSGCFAAGCSQAASGVAIGFFGHRLHTNNFAAAKLNRDGARSLARFHKILERKEQFFWNLYMRTVGRYSNILPLQIGLFGVRRFIRVQGSGRRGGIIILLQLQMAICQITPRSCHNSLMFS